MRSRRRSITFLAFLALVALLPPVAASALGSGWLWPVKGPVTRGFDPPNSPYGSGHRGIDIAVPAGTVAVAPATGTITFAGKVGGRLYLTIDYGDGLDSTFSWLSALLVSKNAVVLAGQPVALTGAGQPNVDIWPNLHMGVRLNGSYVDPLSRLGPADVSSFVHLAPLPAGFG